MAENTHKEQPNSRKDQPWTVRKSVNEALKANELPDLDEKEEMEDDEAESIEQGNPVDVFDHCHRLAENGDVIAYNIYCNNQFKGKKAHPYSWEELQREFGAGHFRVEAKSERTKRFLKQQSNFVSAPTEPQKETSTAASVGEAIRQAMPPKEDPYEQLVKMATLFKSMNPPPPPPREDNSGNVMVEVMKTVMTLQTESQKSTQSLIMEMQKSNREMIEKLGENQTKMLEKLEAKITAGGNEKKEKSMDAMQILALMQKAEDRGRDNYLLIDKLAESKAARMSGGGEDKEPESATDRLIKNVLPAITAALSQPKAPAMIQPPRAIHPRPRAAAPAVPNPPAPGTARPQAPVQAAKPIQPTVLPKVSRDQILEKIMPPIVSALMTADGVKDNKAEVAKTQKEAALQVKEVVKGMGLTLQSTLQMIPQGDMIDIATGAGLPVEAHIWLEGFYANLKELAGASAPSAANGASPRAPVAPRQPEAVNQQPANTERVSG